MSKNIPEMAHRLFAVLEELGYTRENPYRPEFPVYVRQRIETPGYIDFAEPDITAIWPEKGTVSFTAKNEPECMVVDSYDDYGNGNFIETIWKLDGFQDILDSFDEAAPTSASLTLCLASMVLAGTVLLFPTRPVVELIRPSDGKTEPYELVSIEKENDQPVISYMDQGTGLMFTDYSRDLPVEDLIEIINKKLKEKEENNA